MTKHWADGPMAALDFETTGTDPETARIVQAALVVDNRKEYGGMVTVVDCLVDSDVEIPKEATEIHGFTTEIVKKMGFPAKATIEFLIEALTEFDDYPLVICNVPYDWPLLVAEAKRHEIEIVARPSFLDPLLIDRHVDRYRKGSRKLVDMAALYEVPFDGKAHSATADAFTAIGVMREIVNRYPDLRKYSLVELQAVQNQWYEAWKQGVNAYWEKNNKPQRVTNSWPKIERKVAV
ncbi:MAG: exonuclease domain-containing protein [Acidobacteriota bacterium]|jgi:DNA polymerase-3 subunit epsilon